MAKRMQMRIKDPLQFRLLLIEHGWETNKKAATGLGISTYTINELYHQRSVSPGTIVKIANTLDVTPLSIAEYVPH